jgi:hypothetical protein
LSLATASKQDMSVPRVVTIPWGAQDSFGDTIYYRT